MSFCHALARLLGGFDAVALSQHNSPLLAASILAGQACEIFELWLRGADAAELARVEATAARAKDRACRMLRAHVEKLREFEADGSALFEFVEGSKAAEKWSTLSRERKWLYKAAELLHEVVLDPDGVLDPEGVLDPPFFYCLGQTEDRVPAVCTQLATWMLALDAATYRRCCGLSSHRHTWFVLKSGQEISMDAIKGKYWPNLVYMDDKKEDKKDGDFMFDQTTHSTASTVEYLTGYVEEYRGEGPRVAARSYERALRLCPNGPNDIPARKCLMELNPQAAESIHRTNELPVGREMDEHTFITYLMENAVKYMRQKYLEHAGEETGVQTYTASEDGAAQLATIELWLNGVRERLAIPTRKRSAAAAATDVDGEAGPASPVNGAKKARGSASPES